MGNVLESLVWHFRKSLPIKNDAFQLKEIYDQKNKVNCSARFGNNNGFEYLNEWID